MKSCVTLLVALLLAFAGNVFAQRNLTVAPTPAIEQRVALVIGNSAYAESPLKNPTNDAADMAAALRGLGFQVILRANANRRQMVEAVREFGNQIKRGGVGFFYYAGHGVQSRGKNFLIPVGAQLESEADLEFETMDANIVLAQMDEASNRVNIVVLDACRDNPYTRSSRSASRGLAALDAARGSFLAFATAPGSVAADGDGRNGIYTKHLLASLREPDTRLEDVFKRVRLDVAKETGNRQIPWDSSSVLGDFYFRPPAGDVEVVSTAPSAAVTQSISPLAIELAYWQSIKDSTGADDYNAYLERYPSGQFSNLARSRIAAYRKSSSGEIRPSPIADSVADDRASSAQVVIFRKSAFVGMNIELPVTIDGKFIGILASGTYFTLSLNAGLHQIGVSKKSGGLLRGTCRETLDVVAGETHFIEADVGKFGLISDCGLIRTDEPNGVSAIDGLARRN